MQIRRHRNSVVRQASSSVAFDQLEARQLMSANYALDFENDAAGNHLAAGAIIAEQWADWGVHITTNVVDQDHPAMIFDSAHPTGDDADLGSPNKGVCITRTAEGEVYGVGEGYGGVPTDPFDPSLPNPFVNGYQLFNILMVAQSADTSTTDGPSDWDHGGDLILNFDTNVTIESLDVLDIDSWEGIHLANDPTPGAVNYSYVATYDANGAELAKIPLVGYGDNCFQRLLMNQTGVRKLVVSFRGDGSASGAIDNVKFTPELPPPPPPPVPQPEPAALGDRVWYDCDKDGRQDCGERGAAGVNVQLFTPGADGLAGTSDDVYTGKSTVTDACGKYLFSDLPAGDYFVKVTAPAGYGFTKANIGADTLDSDVNASGISQVVNLSPGERDLTVDAGLIKRGGQGLTPGYWKQCHHFSSWTGYKPTDSFEKTFGVDVPGVGPSFTLLQALNDNGGGYRALNRHAAAALLNAANPKINYLYTVDQVIAMTKQAYTTGSFEAIKNLFAKQNELGNVTLK